MDEVQHAVKETVMNAMMSVSEILEDGRVLDGGNVILAPQYMLYFLLTITVVFHIIGLKFHMWTIPNGIPSISVRFAFFFAVVAVWCGAIAHMKSYFSDNDGDSYFGTSTKELLTEGIYSLMRNPYYTLAMLPFVGLAVLLNNWWGIIMGIVMMVYLDKHVIPGEEAHLISVFGEVYELYCQNVSRWGF